MLADLHLHSIYSDGSYTPEELCALAKSRGLSLLSVTDHDTLAGEEEKRAAAKRLGLDYLTGWEISAYADTQKLHILGYGCELKEEYYRFMTERKGLSFLRAEDSVDKLRAAGISVTLEEALAERSSPDLPAHTMHIARAVARRLGITESEAYLRYLGYGRVGYSDVGRPTPQEAIDCIHQNGGVAIVAHPGRIAMDFAERDETLRRLFSLGADGIEAWYTTHTQRDTEYFLALAKEYALLTTGGSDTHIEDGTHAVGTPTFSPSEEFLSRVTIHR